MKVIFYEAFAEETERLGYYLQTHSGIKAEFTQKTIQECSLLNETPPASVISIRNQSEIPVAWSQHLAGILTRSTGFDHIKDYWRACDRKVPSAYLPLYCNRAVAEQSMLLWMALLRKLPRQLKQFNDFDRNGLTGIEAFGKTLVVVGVGNIGKEVVAIGQGLGMKVIGVDIVKKHPTVTYLPIEEALPQADIIVCCMNLTIKNRSYFSRRRLALAPPEAIFINTARGELSPSGGLLELLEEGRLRGVGIDVYNEEKTLAVALREGTEAQGKEAQATLALSRRPDVICTPHNSFNTIEGLERKSAQSIEQLLHLQKHETFLWPVP